MSKKQTVVKVDINNDKGRKEIFAEVGKIEGIQSLVVNEEKKTLTIIGSVEPVPIFKALKKIKKNPEIVTVGPAKPKCTYCQYLQSVCNCGMGTHNDIRGYRYPPSVYNPYCFQPPPPVYDNWYQPPPIYDNGYQPPPPYYYSSYDWPNRQCELVGVAYPPPPEHDCPGQCSIV